MTAHYLIYLFASTSFCQLKLHCSDKKDKKLDIDLNL
jgi:hypothetical protein